MRTSGERGPATDDLIVGAIADSLKPWKPQTRQIETGDKAGYLEEKSKTEVLAVISDAVREEISRLRSTVPDFFDRSAIRKTREDARSVLKAIVQLEEQLSLKTLSPELRLRLGLDSGGARVIGTAADIANLPVPRLLDALETVADICKAADDNQPGTDQIKLWCVRRAIGLVFRFSEEVPTAGSAKTPYCTIASLLYQSVTEEEQQQLRRICQEVLRPYHSAGLIPCRSS